MIRKNRILAICLCPLLLTAFAPFALADVTFELTFEFSGATSPENTPPPAWLTATFSDAANTDNVLLTLTATNLVLTEFVSGWYFNLNPDLEGNTLSIATDGSDSGGSIPAAADYDANRLKADGDGWFDFLFTWNNPSGGSNFFDKDGNYVALLSMNNNVDLDPEDFDFLSAGSRDGVENPAGLLTAAHIQGIGDNGQFSGWITVPVPGAMLLGLLGLGLVDRMRRRLS